MASLIAGLGFFITLIGILGNFAPETLVIMSDGKVPADLAEYALIAGPLLALIGIRLMLEQAKVASHSA